MKTAKLTTIFVLLLTTGCVRKFAINKLGDALAASGAVYASDDDPELIAAAAPFSLKLIESLLAETPKHSGLLLAASRGFTQYAYAFVQQHADEIESENLALSAMQQARARNLYLRARDYGLRGLDTRHRGFREAFARTPRAVSQATKSDVGLLYWTAASWGAAIAISKDRPDLIAEQPQVEALIDRALEIDESFESGAIHAFLISYEPSRPGGEGDPYVRCRRHFDRAVELSKGQLAAPFVALAEVVSERVQDRSEFQTLLTRALAINVDATPEWRLENLVMQRRARWLLSRIDELFAQEHQEKKS
jgi:predicted anti-sigma-YlaC factor YlaD